MEQMIFFALIFVVMYFFFIRPQAKKQKDQEKFLNEIAKGDQVITSGGIVVKITKVEDKFVELQTDNKNFLRVVKSNLSKEYSNLLTEKPQS